MGVIDKMRPNKYAQFHSAKIPLKFSGIYGHYGFNSYHLFMI